MTSAIAWLALGLLVGFTFWASRALRRYAADDRIRRLDAELGAKGPLVRELFHVLRKTDKACSSEQAAQAAAAFVKAWISLAPANRLSLTGGPDGLDTLYPGALDRALIASGMFPGKEAAV